MGKAKAVKKMASSESDDACSQHENSDGTGHDTDIYSCQTSSEMGSSEDKKSEGNLFEFTYHFRTRHHLLGTA